MMRFAPSLLDGLRAQEIAEAAIASLRTNRPVRIQYWQPEHTSDPSQESQGSVDVN